MTSRLDHQSSKTKEKKEEEGLSFFFCEIAHHGTIHGGPNFKGHVKNHHCCWEECESRSLSLPLKKYKQMNISWQPRKTRQIAFVMA
jgi:hypothetical protein